MRIEVDVSIDAPQGDVWELVSDIENSAATISGIESVEVLERPTRGLPGLKWKETRTIFGKTATETMWITEASERHYVTEAQSHGSIYRTRVEVTEQGRATRLGMSFEAEAKSIGAKVTSLVFGFLMKSAVRKGLLQDVRDVKKVAEARALAKGA